MKMKLSFIIFLALAVAALQAGVATAQDGRDTEAAMQAAQYRAGAAFRQLQQTQYDAKLAEQDYLSAQDTHRAAQQSDAAKYKHQVESTKRALDAAQVKVVAARKTYEKEVNAVDLLHGGPAAVK